MDNRAEAKKVEEVNSFYYRRGKERHEIDGTRRIKRSE